MANPPPPQGKSAHRHRARSLLAQISEAGRLAGSRRLADHIADWLAENSHLRCIAVFAATSAEPDLAQLHEVCPDHVFCYPLSGQAGTMEFHEVSDPGTLIAGAYGIREPRIGTHPHVRPGQIDAIFCPGLAFGPDGHRLGHGAGFYDRYLSRLDAGVPRLGICFPQQLIERVPVEPHDISMTHLVTESGVLEVRKA